MAVAIRLDLVRPLSDEELRACSARNPGYQFERTAEGDLIVSPTGSDSGRRTVKLAYQLEHWNRQARTGVVFDSSTGFRLPDGSCLSPDASWVRLDRWRALDRQQREGFAPLCPDAVFEVRSPSNTLAELREKMRAYLANGARVALLVDPERRAVEVHRPGREPAVHQPAGTVALDPELAGFTLDLEPIFGE